MQGGHGSIAVMPINPAWTSIASSTWIWGETLTDADAATGTTEVFTKDFSVTGTSTSGSLDIAADNGYILKVNGMTVDDRSFIEDNFTSSHHYDVTGYLHNGTNTMEVTVSNAPRPGETANSNPAGLLFRLTVMGATCGTGTGGGNTGGGGTGTTTQATSTSHTIVVRQGDLATSQGDAMSSSKWFFWNGATGAIDSNSAGSFVNGPGTALLGSGSVLLTATDTMSHSIATYQFGGTRLADITALSFSSYEDSGASTTASTTAPFFAFNVDLQGNATGTGQLVYMPEQNGTVASSTWQNWNLLGSGKWTWSGYATTSTSTPSQWPDLNMAQFRSWSSLMTAFPNSRVSLADPLLGIGIKNATTSATANAYIDNLLLTVASSTQHVGSTTGFATTTIFDFEPTVNSGGNSGGNGGGGGGGHSHSSSSNSGTNNDNFGIGGDGEVLGASCPLITSWMREGQVNDSNQVSVLQSFLNGEMSANLSVSGVFDNLTTNWVNAFQVKYWSDVLAPWVPYGLPTDHTPTGYVYKTTQVKINRIACPDMAFDNPMLP
jgi:hypothetical protein